MAHDVFISYSSYDQKVVEALSHYLEERGVRCFVAYRDIPPGIVWAGAITQAIENCRLMVVVFSKDFNVSDQVDREIELCAEEKKPILTFRIHNENFKGVKKYYLKNLNWIDAFPNPVDCFQNLYESVTKLLGIEPLEITPETLTNEDNLCREREELEGVKIKLEEERLRRELAEIKAEKARLQEELNLSQKQSNNIGNEKKSKVLENPVAPRNAATPPPETKGEPVSKTKDFTETVNGVHFDMVYVEGGTFLMGSPGNEPDREDDEVQHRVTLSSYYIGRTEVTQALWKTVMGTNPSYFKGENLPVEQVSWDDCQDFVAKLNRLTGKTYRLPTEAEWEYAARGGNRSKGYRYSGSNTLDEVAWYEKNSGYETQDVGTKTANELGVYDMSGNVWEWCQDWYGDYITTPQTNPMGSKSGMYSVSRGGGWGGGWGDMAQNCRVACRNYGPPVNCLVDLGLRLALVP